MAQGNISTPKPTTNNNNTMSTEKPPPKTPTKRGTGAGSTSGIDSVIPLLFATMPGMTPNYAKMSAMDEHGRTTSALEHKFRKWRQMGREILAAHPEEAGTDKVVGQPAKTKNPRSGAGGGGGGKKGKQASNGGGGGMLDDDESFDDGGNGNGKNGVRKEDDDSDYGGSKKTSPKKRGASINTGDESPTKKAKARQNGKAAATKKAPAAKKTPRSHQNPFTDEQTNGDAEGAAVKEEDEFVSASEGETNNVELSFEQV